MPSPYKTKCFDYNKIGCKSRIDCVDRCNVEWTLKHCNGSLPMGNTFVDRHNDKDIFKEECDDNYKEYCNQKYKHPDCFNEYYEIKIISEKKIKDWAIEKKSNKVIDEYLKQFNITNFKARNKNARADISLVSQIILQFNTEPDTIYTHSPQQYPIEFICFIGGVISLWTGFSVLSIYAFGKRFLGRKQNKIEPNTTPVYVIHNHIKKIVFINNKKNDKISSIKKLRKFEKKKNILNKMNYE